MSIFDGAGAWCATERLGKITERVNDRQWKDNWMLKLWRVQAEERDRVIEMNPLDIIVQRSIMEV